MSRSQFGEGDYEAMLREADDSESIRLENAELGQLLHIEGAETYSTNESGQPVDDWGQVIDPDAPAQF